LLSRCSSRFRASSQEISIVEFFTETEWSPGLLNPVYGVWPIVVGTLIVVITALIVAIPLGLLSAIYLSEYAPNAVRKTIKPVLEILEGIPTVATGLFAFFWLRPFLEYLTPWLPWGGLVLHGVAGIAVGLIIVPLIASVSDDAMRSVPRSLREGAYALGAGKMRVAPRVVVPAAILGNHCRLRPGGISRSGRNNDRASGRRARVPLPEFQPL
jgi:phosphate transport system permease protein